MGFLRKEKKNLTGCAHCVESFVSESGHSSGAPELQSRHESPESRSVAGTAIFTRHEHNSRVELEDHAYNTKTSDKEPS